MRLAALAAILVSGCAVQVGEIRRPYVAARIDSTKPASQFSQCVGQAMNLPVRSDEGILTITRTNKTGVQVARWDFFATNNGSQAELRTGADDDAGLSIVRSCA